MFFKLAQKVVKYLGYAFVTKFAAQSFQNSPNLVTLLSSVFIWEINQFIVPWHPHKASGLSNVWISLKEKERKRERESEWVRGHRKRANMFVCVCCVQLQNNSNNNNKRPTIVVLLVTVLLVLVTVFAVNLKILYIPGLFVGCTK